jgi:eukaryotic-like serine/threonine-protein kinase
LSDPASSSPPKLAAISPPWTLDTVVADRFVIIRELGRGGMGAVYIAFDRVLCRDVALKRLHPEARGNLDLEARFEREYRALASISDPGVPQVHHSGRSDGAPWFSMEVVHGESLRASLDRGAFEPMRALALAIQLAKILAVAHARGVIHRDVKPNNIMIEPGDRVRLLDFGVCTPLPRFLRAFEARRQTAHIDRWHSAELQFAGTLGYSDPATHDGSPCTVRSDIYSVAVILYEMLTGRRFFDPDTYVFRRIDDAELPVALAPLGDLLRRATDREPVERPRTMNDVVQQLEILRNTALRPAANTRPNPRRQAPALGLTLALVLTVGLLAGIALGRLGAPSSGPREQPAAAATPDRAAIEPPPATAPATPDSTPQATPPDPAPPPPPTLTPAIPAPATTRPATPAPRATPTTLRAQARRQLDRHTAAIRGCADDHGPPLAHLDVTLHLASDGRVREVSPATQQPDQLVRCLGDVLTDRVLPPRTPSPLTHRFRLRNPP